MAQEVRLHISCITKSTSIVLGPSKACPLDAILAVVAGPAQGIPMIVFGLSQCRYNLYTVSLCFDTGFGTMRSLLIIIGQHLSPETLVE